MRYEYMIWTDLFIITFPRRSASAIHVNSIVAIIDQSGLLTSQFSNPSNRVLNPFYDSAALVN
jgi:hypothetical protein